MAADLAASAHAQRMKDIPAAARRSSRTWRTSDAVDRPARRAGCRLHQDRHRPARFRPGNGRRARRSGAHACDLKTVAHASRSDAVAMAQRAGIDVLTHVPLDRPIDDGRPRSSPRAGAVVVPTLTMMKGIVERLAATRAFPVRAYEPAGDAWPRSTRPACRSSSAPTRTQTPAAPASPAFGEPACTTSWRCSSTPGSRPSRRCAPPPRAPPSTSGSPTVAHRARAARRPRAARGDPTVDIDATRTHPRGVDRRRTGSVELQ